jgi:hypothetical protein
MEYRAAQAAGTVEPPIPKRRPFYRGTGYHADLSFYFFPGF